MAATTTRESKNGATRQRSASRQNTGEHSDQQTGRTWAEWVSLGISVAIIGALVAAVVYLHLAGSDEPVRLDVQVEAASARQADGLYYLPVTIHNLGGETGEDVLVRLALDTPEGDRHLTELRVNFLAPNATHRGTVAFPANPAAGQITIHSLSYAEP